MEINGIEVLKDGNNYVTKKMIRIEEFWNIYKKCEKIEHRKNFQITMITDDDQITIKFQYDFVEISEEDYDMVDSQIEFYVDNYDYGYDQKVNAIILNKIQKCIISFNKEGYWNGIIFDSSTASRKYPLTKTYIEQYQREYDRKKKSIRVNDIEAIRDGHYYYSNNILDINNFFEMYKGFSKCGCGRGYEFNITMKCQDTLVKNLFVYSCIGEEFSKDDKSIVKKFYCEPQSSSAIFMFNKKQKCKVVFRENIAAGGCTGIRISDLDSKIYEQSVNSYSRSYSQFREDDEERYGNAVDYMKDNGYDPENDSFDDM